MSKIDQYRNGGQGFVKWAEENVNIPIYPQGSMIPVWTPISDLPNIPNPETGRSPVDLWNHMAQIALEALAMEGGVFIYRLIVLCWMRGEAKSMLTCLIQLWKFFMFPAQLIALGANSRDQVKFVHFDIMRDIILNSPKLLRVVGRKNLQEKEIRLKDRDGITKSTIRSISSFSGIVSNITGYTFSEIFDLKTPKFFYQLDGSIRNIPNALGIIDSTVSVQDHILTRLYKIWVHKKDPTLYFSHRESPKADYRDYWHPAMTQKQLDSYRVKFPPSEFNQYFKNTWGSGSQKLFSPELVYATRVLGFGGQLGMQDTVLKTLGAYRKCQAAIRRIDKGEEGGDHSASMNRERLALRMREELAGLQRVSDVYQLADGGIPRMASRDELEKLTKLYNTDWAILVGIDRSDPLTKVSGARTILTAIAKGLPGSRVDPTLMYDLGAKSYIYFILHLTIIGSARIDDIKLELSSVHSEYDGIEVIGGERWGLWDLATWCTDNDITFVPVQPNWDKQREAFTELFQLYKTGLIKVPPLKVSGSKGPDILVEEALCFDYDSRTRTYGSPEKREKFGTQDDAMYALGWGIWSGKNLTVEDFRPRTSDLVFGEFFKEPMLGRY